jgi:uncharacterized protein (DUF58 family)
MTRRPSPRLAAYLVIGAAGLLAGPVFGRPEPVILVAPILLAAVIALLGVEDPEIDIEVSVARDRVLERDEIDLEVLVRAPRTVHWLELAPVLPRGMVPREAIGVLGVRLEPGVERRLELVVASRRWGTYRVGKVVLRARDRFGFFAFEQVVDRSLAIRVFPRPETLQRVVRAAETQLYAGNEISRVAGDGIEFAGVRPYAPGDEIRRVNWRLSSRRPEVHVNERHPERSTDLVILLDAFTDLEGELDESSLATAVRGAYGIADYYLRRRDRVGLIAFGSSIRWLAPQMGLGHAYRIVETLLDARATPSVMWKGVDLIPPRSLPPKALVLALSPLIDHRAIETLMDLRGRGFDVAIIEVPPEAFIDRPATQFGELSRRLWQLQRELVRDRFRRLGVPVAPWAPDAPLQVALEEIRAFRQHSRRSAA